MSSLRRLSPRDVLVLLALLGCSARSELPEESEHAHCDRRERLSDEALHAAALAALVPASKRSHGPCASSGCHDADAHRAKLVLDHHVDDLRAALVHHEACEVHLPLVDGEGGAHALEHSWLWQKLTAHVEHDGALEANPDWGVNAICGQRMGDPYGARMPLAAHGESHLSESKLDAVRRWICAGAPGPDGDDASHEPSSHDEE